MLRSVGASVFFVLSWGLFECDSRVVLAGPDDLLSGYQQDPSSILTEPQAYIPILPKPEIYSLHVKSFIKYRYAHTRITSKVANPANRSQEVHFNAILPDTAFITTFHMEINGKEYKAYVKEKDLARHDYQEAVESGLSAAHVKLSARDYNKFSISVNVEAHGKVHFVLTYEQLLARIVGLYNHVIHINPGQIVRDMEIEVHIVESSPITRLQIPEIRSAAETTDDEKENPFAEIKLLSGNEVNIKYRPSVEQQAQFVQQLTQLERESFVAQFAVKYDVDREAGGQVLLQDGYFVHFFSPKDLPPLPKLAVFVLDVSGSMEGRKLEQLKQAMSRILDDLGPRDYFNIIEFSYSVTVHNLDSATGSIVLAPDVALQTIDGEKGSNWTEFDKRNRQRPQTYPATKFYINKAKQVITKMSSGGGTNIHDALKNSLIVAKSGLRKLMKMRQNKDIDHTSPPDTIEPIVIFLTDGDPTVGITNPRKILSMVKELNNHSTCAIFSLGFGDGADLNFLRKLSLANAGFARNIYEASDAALQLNNFYKEIASPLLSNVTFFYLPGQVTESTRHHFQTLFLGSELVVAGKTLGNNANCTIKAITANGTKEFHIMGWRDLPDNMSDVIYSEEEELFKKEEFKRKEKKTVNTMERLWAYLSVKQLLDQYEMGNENMDDQTLQNVQNRVLKLALKYEFVTLLTSLVVIKPNQTIEIDTNSLKPSTPEFVVQSFPAAGGSGQTLVERIDSIDDTLLSGDLTIHDIEWIQSFQTPDNISIDISINNETKQYLISMSHMNLTYQECSINDTETYCAHLIDCILPDFTHSLDEYLPYFCPINDRFAGVCCVNRTDESDNISTTWPYFEATTSLDPS